MRRYWMLTLLLLLGHQSAFGMPIVTFTLICDPTDMTFDLYAESSFGDNGGIASYGVPLLGDILTLDHLAPTGIDPGSGSAVGFSLFRSADGAAAIQASQNNLDINAPLVYGLGQTSGDLNTDFPGLLLPEQPIYGVPLHLASGTWGTMQPEFDLNSVDFGANVFDGMTRNVLGADAQVNKVSVPEPSIVWPAFWICFIMVCRSRWKSQNTV